VSDPTSPLDEFGGPPVDPRFRRRWAEARRAEGRRRLHILVALVAVAVLIGGGIGLLYSPVFRVRNVLVVGNVHTPTAEVLSAAGLAPGATVLMVDAGPVAATRALDALPWVAGVTFERRWPWTLIIKVRERSPVAGVLANSAGAEDLVDESGRVLGMSPAKVATLPVVTGVQGAPPGASVSPGPGLDQSDMDELLAAAAASPRRLAQRGLRLAYSGTSGLVGYMGSAKTEVLLGDASDLGVKLAVLEELASRVNLAGYAQADLTVPERPALTPLPSGLLGTD
jgi:cell division protein FtsQ